VISLPAAEAGSGGGGIGGGMVLNTIPAGAVIRPMPGRDLGLAPEATPTKPLATGQQNRCRRDQKQPAI
jgi:hypothetical protein